MKVICNANDCFGCLACVNVCPKKCININYNNQGFIIPSIDENKCINCDRCVKSCPVNASIQLNSPIKVYAGQINNFKLAMQSTSGGIFQALARVVLNHDGIVCAAKQESNNYLHHVIIRNEEELKLSLKSKYYQSSVEYTYTDIKKYLISGIKVFFCGTPCQVAGLLSFLGKSYDNLITCDLICHGVPSKKVVDKYIFDKECQYKSKLNEILFRDKSNGWNNMRISLNFENGKKYSNVAAYDDFYFGFFRGLYYRKSCYHCPFATESRVADISLGDFWGIEYTQSNLDPQKGISLILANTVSGENLIKSVETDISLEIHTMEEAKRLNHNLKAPSKMNPNQDKFYSLLDSHTLRYSLFRTLPIKYLKFKIKRFIKSII